MLQTNTTEIRENLAAVNVALAQANNVSSDWYMLVHCLESFFRRQYADDDELITIIAELYPAILDRYKVEKGTEQAIEIDRVHLEKLLRSVQAYRRGQASW